MSGLEKRRILVVEDKSTISDLYRHHLENAGYLVDVAERRSTAINALRTKLYDLALVDLMLKEDVTHKGGFDVLDTIDRLQDGTRAIVVTASTDIRDAVASHNRRIASSFLMKGEFDAKELIAAVGKALDGHRRSLTGDFPSLVAYLAAPQVTPVWEDHVRMALDCSYASVQKILWNSLKRYLPLLRRKDGTLSFEIRKDQNAVAGSFWSKATGHAIWFSASGAAGKFIEPTDLKSQRLGDYTAKNVVAAIWRIDAARDDYMENIRDRPGQQ